MLNRRLRCLVVDNVSIRSNRIKRILFITGQLGLGGAEKQLYLLSSGLLARGWSVSVISLNGGAGDYWEEPLRKCGVFVSQLHASSGKATRLKAIRRVLLTQRPEIVHSWTIYANIYAAVAGRLAGTPYRIGSERANHHSSRRDIGNFWYSQSLRGLDALVTNSLPAAEYLRAFRPALKTFLVRNAIELPHEFTCEQRERLREEFGVPKNCVVLGAVGSLVPRKNVSFLIEAISALSRNRSDVHFVVIGDGPLREKLYADAMQALSPERVHFYGAQPNAARLFPLFDVFCFPSLDQEGMPNVLMEAASWGIPAVATDVGGVREVIEDAETGFIVDVTDPGQMAERIELLLSNPALRKTMGDRAREKMQKEFSVDRMITTMEDVYEQIR